MALFWTETGPCYAALCPYSCARNHVMTSGQHTKTLAPMMVKLKLPPCGMELLLFYENFSVRGESKMHVSVTGEAKALEKRIENRLMSRESRLLLHARNDPSGRTSAHVTHEGRHDIIVPRSRGIRSSAGDIYILEPDGQIINARRP